jgi:F-type H+-transporting ATPase subunit b
MLHLLENPETWVLVAFILFVALVLNKAWKFITTNLDVRAGKISAELEEAARLREEAQSLLSHYQIDHRGAEAEVARMLEVAREEGEKIVLSAQERLAALLSQKEAQAQQNLRHAEVQLLDDIRSEISVRAVTASRELIQRSLDSEKASRLLDLYIDEVGNKLSAR